MAEEKSRMELKSLEAAKRARDGTGSQNLEEYMNAIVISSKEEKSAKPSLWQLAPFYGIFHWDDDKEKGLPIVGKATLILTQGVYYTGAGIGAAMLVEYFSK